MRYPNAYKGVLRLYYTEPLSLLFITIPFFSKLLVWNGVLSASFFDTFSGVTLLLGIIVTVVRVMALGCAALDGEQFRTAQNMAFLPFGLTLISVFVKGNMDFATYAFPWILIVALGIQIVDIAGVFTSLYATMYIIKGIENLADLAGEREFHRLGRNLHLRIRIMAALVLAGGVISCFVGITQRGGLFAPPPKSSALFQNWYVSLIIFVCIGEILADFVEFLLYLGKAKDMLFYAPLQEDSTWIGSPVDYRGGDNPYRQGETASLRLESAMEAELLKQIEPLRYEPDSEDEEG